MPKITEYLVNNFTDPWILFGFFAQFIFFLRFAIQWIVSEKEKKIVIPIAFWYLSIAGSLMLIIYSIKRTDIVFTTASVLNTMIYLRNIILIRNNSKKTTKKSSSI